MEINDALVTAITREILRRLKSGEISLETPSVQAAAPCCSGPVCQKPAAAASGSGRRKVISEIDMMRLCPASGGIGQAVDIGVRDIVTPLAVDYIAKMRITVNRIG